MSNHHRVLGVSPGASAKQIRDAFVGLSKRHHPDVGGDPEKFKEINAAYQALSVKTDTRESRQREQRYPFDKEFESVFKDFTEAMNNRRRRRHVFSVVNLKPEDFFQGTALNVEFNSGERATIRIPAGFVPGDRITYEHPDLNLDVELDLRLVPDPSLRWGFDGRNLHYLLDIDAIDAMLGNKIEFRHLGGEKLSVTVPAGSGNQTILRIPGRGVPARKHFPGGDLHIKLNINVTKITDPNHIKQLREIQRSITE
jgi:curved DNA-binding protein